MFLEYVRRKIILWNLQLLGILYSMKCITIHYLQEQYPINHTDYLNKLGFLRTLKGLYMYTIIRVLVIVKKKDMDEA